MANWCDTNYVVVGEEKEVLEFHKTIKGIINGPERQRSDFGSEWLGNVLDYFGYDWKEIPCRGYISHLDESVDKGAEDGQYSFYLSTETAWVPMNEMFDTIFNEKYQTLSYYYMAEEPGCELFETNDKKGLYFKDLFFLNLAQSLKMDLL